MEHRYLETTFGKIHAAIVSLTLPVLLIAFAIDYSRGKEANLWGMLISLAGFICFLKAKISVIKKGKLFSVGCDPMDQKNTYFYFCGWVLMVAGYFFSWS